VRACVNVGCACMSVCVAQLQHQTAASIVSQRILNIFKHTSMEKRAAGSKER
jgi:hypothetical protein